jgi:hypothetical protein
MYETTFEDGSLITDYLAVAYAEGFEECSLRDKVKAWSYLCGTRLGFSLQGFFGRSIAHYIEQHVMSSEGAVDWEYIEELINN